MSKIKELYKKYVLHTYVRVGPIFIKGKGSWLWSESGRRYLDLFPGWGVGILGHNHPRLVKIISQQAKELIFLPNNLYHRWQAILAEKIVENSFPAQVFFANSGAEAVEGALKFSRLYGKKKSFEVIIMENSFHGRTFGALSATGQEKYKEAFKPLLPGFKKAKFNDFSDFRKKITKKTTAVLMELIQGEGGVNVACKEYVKKVYNYCKKHDLLFIVDEVQTGMARTGKMFCYQHYGIKPDIMLLAKGLGGGIPISCMVIRKSIADIMKIGMHASTFGGNPFSSRIAIEVFKIIKEENILKNVRVKSIYLFSKLKEFKEKFSVIGQVKGKGLMIGIELNVEAQSFFNEALKRGLLINVTHKNVLRIMPALNITKEELDKGLNILREIFKKF